MRTEDIVVKGDRTLEITPQLGCPNDCSYCPQEKLIKAYSHHGDQMTMDYSDFKRCLSTVPSSVRIDFAGFSEPALHPDFVSMLLHAYQRGFKTTVFTTGINLTAEDIDAIKKVPFEFFVVHLPDNRGYTKIEVDAQYIKVLEQLIKNKISGLCFVCLGYQDEVKTDPRLDEVLAGQKIERLSPISRAGNVDWKKVPAIQKIKGPIPTCKRLIRGMLLPNGDVALCCMDWGLQHIIGNLIRSDYQSLWRGREFKNIMKGLDDDSLDILCRHCEKTYENCRKFYSQYRRDQLIKAEKTIRS